MKQKTNILISTLLLMALGLILLKYLPMYFFGQNILFDASQHIVLLAFGLYFIYIFIENKPKIRIPYMILTAMLLTIIGIQRIIAKAHNEYGVLLGFLVAGISILIPRWKEVRRVGK